VTLSWSAPAAIDSSAVTRYKLYYSDPQATILRSSTPSMSSASTNATRTELHGGRIYRFAVTAVSAFGESDLSVAVLKSTAPPKVVGITNAAQTSSSVTLAWSAPLIAGGANVTGYTVYKISSAGSSTQVFSGAATRAVITGLASGARHTFAVEAISDTGRGDRSALFGCSTTPGAPTSLSAVSVTA
jgi:titin